MEEYKLMICHVTTLGGNIEKYEKICELTMCKYCKNWNLKEGSFGICDDLGLITPDNFSCIDGEKKDVS